MRWGLVPAWSKSLPSQLSTINARSDSLLQKPLWKQVIKQRCIVLAQGYYEWDARGKDRVAYYISRPEHDDASGDLDLKLLWMAGLYSCYMVDGQKMWSYTIITTDSSVEIQRVHHRMPVIFSHRSEMDTWLSDASFDDNLQALLQPFKGSLKMYTLTTADTISTPVSNFVNKVGNNSPKCIQPVKAPRTLDSFFAKGSDKDKRI